MLFDLLVLVPESEDGVDVEGNSRDEADRNPTRFTKLYEVRQSRPSLQMQQCWWLDRAYTTILDKINQLVNRNIASKLCVIMIES